MMKGKFAVVAFAALLGVSSTAMADNKDGDGKIEFFGNIIDAGCQIDTGASNLSVKLGDVAKTTFTAAG
ncbi:type 1 fimbrial protein, partial [Salmonella enterica]|nr:type 1 fimbrial protein [Salmonella enterica]